MNEELEKLLHEALQRKMEDGSIETILGKYIDDAVKNALNDLFNHNNWRPEDNGEGYNYVKKTISPLIMKALETSNLDFVAKKTKLAIDQLIAQSSIAQTGKALNGALGLFNDEIVITYGQKFDFKLIFDAYKRYLANDLDKNWCEDNNVDIDTDDGDATAYITACCEVEDIETNRYAYKSKSVTLYVQEEEDEGHEEHKIAFIIEQDYANRWIVKTHSSMLGLSDLKYMNEVELLLYSLATHWADLENVKDIEENLQIDHLEE